MTDKLNPTILQALNLTEQDFEPKPMTPNNAVQTEPNDADARIAELEQAIRILLGGDTDAE